MIIGECKIDTVKKLSIKDLWKYSATKAMIPWSDFSSYFQGVDYGYAVNVYAYIRYDKPKKLSTALGKDSPPPQSYRYLPNTVQLSK